MCVYPVSIADAECQSVRKSFLEKSHKNYVELVMKWNFFYRLYSRDERYDSARYNGDTNILCLYKSSGAVYSARKKQTITL